MVNPTQRSVFRETPNSLATTSISTSSDFSYYSSFVFSVHDTSLTSLNGVAVDRDGNIFLTDHDSRLVLKETRGTYDNYTKSVIATLPEAPTSMMVDTSGAVYVVAGLHLYTFTPGTGDSYTAGAVASFDAGMGLTAPSGLSMDGASNFYLADAATKKVFRINGATPPSYDFGSVNVGSSATHSNVLINAGTALLSVASSGTPNPDAVLPFRVTSNSTCPVVAANATAVEAQPGTVCTYEDSFSPTSSGAVAGTSTLTTNVNGSPAVFSFTGTGASTLSVASIAPATGFTTGLQGVVITGTSFGSLDRVTVDGTPISVTSSTRTSITLNMPAHVAGVATVTVYDALGQSASATFTYTHPRGSDLSLNIAGTHTLGDADFNVAATSSSPGTITYTVLSGQASATVDASTGRVHILGAGDVTIRATQAAATGYTAGTADARFTTAKATATMSLSAIAGKTFGDVDFQVIATTNSDLPIYYSIVGNTSVVSVDPGRGIVHILSAGSTTVQAQVPPSNNYTGATATTLLTVQAIAPTLAFVSVPSKTFGDADFAVSASSASSGSVTYSIVSGNASASINPTTGAVNILAAGSVRVRADQVASGGYSAASAEVTFAINPAATVLAFATVANKTYGDADFQVSASSLSDGPITYSVKSGGAFATVNAASGLVHVLAPGSVTLQADQAAAGNYGASSAEVTFSIRAATPTLTFGAIGTKTFGDPDFFATASSASNGAITYSITSGNSSATIDATGGLVHILGAGPITVHAAQAASTNYTAASADINIVINASAPRLTFNAIGSKAFGDLDFVAVATSPSNGAITYSITSGTAATVNATTGLVHIVGTGSVTLHTSQAATANYAASTADVIFTVSAVTPSLSFATIRIAHGRRTRLQHLCIFGIERSSAIHDHKR